VKEKDFAAGIFFSMHLSLVLQKTNTCIVVGEVSGGAYLKLKHTFNLSTEKTPIGNLWLFTQQLY